MKQSSVSFSSAPSSVPGGLGAALAPFGASGSSGGSGADADSDSDSVSVSDSLELDELGLQFDELLRAIAADDASIAAAEARRARHLAAIAAVAARMSRRDGTAATSAGREWVRRKLAAEIGCATHRTEGAVSRLIDESERLVDELPATLTALESGEISYRHARVMIGHAITVPASARASFEQQLLPVAAALAPHRFDIQAHRLRERVHPDSIIDRTRAAHAERHVAFSVDGDGMASIRHHLPVVDALAIDDLIDKIARSQRGEGGPGERLGGPPTPGESAATTAGGADAAASSSAIVSAEARRTHAQRRSDALTNLILGRGERPRITPSVVVTVKASTIAGADDDPAELHGYGPIDPVMAREIAALAPTFLRALTRPDSSGPVVVTRHRARPVADAAVGRDQHDASPMLRTALMLADDTCRFPNCGRRASRCELDHTHAWAEGGRTTPDNLAHPCPKHHHLKHDGGWKVTGSDDGTRTLHWTSPRGTRYATHPGGTPPEPVAPRPGASAPACPHAPSAAPPPPSGSSTAPPLPTGQIAAPRTPRPPSLAPPVAAPPSGELDDDPPPF
ncbi:HNH endonuclease signature motif containing protein [Herbiconiux daphne]|uniref:HNH endonuclease n=1 Tax=Herbiconiux daphne TaxID=2970914 RepID=A0ABT2H3Y2_9MICO|nr:HNH endonuclease signature motif containing protein [Herbiconiux daphne]MCS5734641.1 HNH endonuclease [Herbiconiux daphne]